MTAPPPPPGDRPDDGRPPPPYANAPGYGAPPYAYGGSPSPRNGMGTAALVVGIIGLLCSLFLGWVVIGIPLGIVLGIIALILGIVGRRRVRRGEATNGGSALSGIILGAIAIVIAIAIAIIYAFVFARGGLGNYVDCVRQAGGDQQKVQQCEQQFRDRVG